VLLLRNCDGTRSPLHRFRITTTESVPSERSMKRDRHRITCQIQLFQISHSAQLRQTECQRGTMPSAPSIHQIAKECSPQRATKPSTPTKREIAKEWFLIRHWPTRPNTSARSEQDSFIGPHKIIAHQAQKYVRAVRPTAAEWSRSSFWTTTPISKGRQRVQLK
jgi:hypothetical protein